jgi:hypothetical protein
VTHAPEPLNEIESRSTAGKNSLSNLWFFTFETHEHGSFTDSIVYPSRRAFKVAKFSSSKQPGRYGLVAELYFHDEAGWSWGLTSAIDSNGRTIWIADAHRDDGKRFIVRADEKLTAFVELEMAVCIHLLSEQC